MKKLSVLFLVSPFLVAAGGCAAEKSSNPLSPSVAGPIPGVNITAPSPIEPKDGQRIATDTQPVTLRLGNATTSGPRPLSYLFELATDAGFTSRVFTREGIVPGDGGSTSLRLPDPLASGRSYYWRALAQDGANTGPYSPPAHFDVFTPVVFQQPVPIAPIGNVTVTSLRPTFRWINAPRAGPAGAVAYDIEVSETDSFALKVTATVGEQPNETSIVPPQDGEPNKQYFWRVRAFDPTTTGPWSATQVFRTPASAPSGGGGTGTSGHLGPGPLTADRARQVVFGTASEFPGLLAVFSTDAEAVAAADQLLLRTIWHLQLAGYQAARQRNPSGLISSDKMNIFIDGAWQLYDIFSLGYAGRATYVQFFKMDAGGASPVPSGGIPD